jgi:hypothetical protein
MVAGFCVAAVQVEVANDLVSRGIPKEEASEVVFVELGALITHPPHAYMCAKELEVLQVRFDAPPAFEGGDTSSRVYPTIVKVDRMQLSRRPIFGFQSHPV